MIAFMHQRGSAILVSVLTTSRKGYHIDSTMSNSPRSSSPQSTSPASKDSSNDLLALWRDAVEKYESITGGKLLVREAAAVDSAQGLYDFIGAQEERFKAFRKHGQHPLLARVQPLVAVVGTLSAVVGEGAGIVSELLSHRS